MFASAIAEHKDFVSGMKIWTACLVDVSEKLTAQLSTMGLLSIRYSHDDRISESARVTMFLKAVLDALKLLHDGRATHLANESRKLCQGALLKVLTKVAYRNPGLDFNQDSLPADADRRALEELVMPVVSLVDHVTRVEGQCRD